MTESPLRISSAAQVSLTYVDSLITICQHFVLGFSGFSSFHPSIVTDLDCNLEALAYTRPRRWHDRRAPTCQPGFFGQATRPLPFAMIRPVQFRHVRLSLQLLPVSAHRSSSRSPLRREPSFEERFLRHATKERTLFGNLICLPGTIRVLNRTSDSGPARTVRAEDGRTSSLLKNAVVAFFNLAKCGAKLCTARKIATCGAILTSHPCGDAAC